MSKLLPALSAAVPRKRFDEHALPVRRGMRKASMSSPLGRITLWQEFGISKELMAAAIAVMALMAFWLAGLAEKWAPYDRRQITGQKSGFHAED